MTTKELAESSGVSEATVVRFVSRIGFRAYSAFQQALKDFVNTGMSLPERAAMEGDKEPGLDRLHRCILEEINNLKHLYETISIETLNTFVSHLDKSPSVYVVGSRISYTFAYHLGWSLTKIRKGVHILKGSDTTAMDWLANASQPDALVILITTSRYPNEMIRLSKMIRRNGNTLFTMTDSSICPLIQFSDACLVVPAKSIPFIGNVCGMTTAIQYIVQELANTRSQATADYQKQLEQMYLENDILFNLDETVKNSTEG